MPKPRRDDHVIGNGPDGVSIVGTLVRYLEPRGAVIRGAPLNSQFGVQEYEVLSVTVKHWKRQEHEKIRQRRIRQARPPQPLPPQIPDGELVAGTALDGSHVEGRYRGPLGRYYAQKGGRGQRTAQIELFPPPEDTRVECGPQPRVRVYRDTVRTYHSPDFDFPRPIPE